jgi:enoyl-CoA hydratase/carnithine racemase
MSPARDRSAAPEADLRVDVRGSGLAVITLARDPVLNALRRQTLRELEEALQLLESDPSVRVIVLAGDGRAFCAGADIREFASLTSVEASAFIQQGQEVFDHLSSSPIPSIAALSGVVLGGGCELALACDIRIADASTRFGQPEVKLGHIPGWGSCQRLPATIGRSQALRLLLTGATVSASEALDLGLVDVVAPENGCLAAALALAEDLVNAAPIAVRAIKRAVDIGIAYGVSAGLDAEREGFDECFRSRDHVEGFRAFEERRNPTFTGD